MVLAFNKFTGWISWKQTLNQLAIDTWLGSRKEDILLLYYIFQVIKPNQMKSLSAPHWQRLLQFGHLVKTSRDFPMLLVLFWLS